MLIDSIKDVKKRITAACERCGRDVSEVKLIAVSKTLPASRIEEAYKAGLRIFGESRPQEVRDKTKILPPDIDWHFIGPLQKNKIKYVLPDCSLVHSVDSFELAEAISQFCMNKQIKADILLEVNTSKEATKIGVIPDEVTDIFTRVDSLNGINVKGLMTIAPFTNDMDAIRESFRLLSGLKENLKNEINRDQQFELSMGMSQDFEIAIEEGSTMIRVGTSIFGSRGR